MNRTKDFIKHFSSQPYDPVKAHEYYIKNRDLKGRTSSGMSDTQKEAWSYSKSQITSDKKEKLAAYEAENKRKIEAFQKSADETRTRISEKIQQLKDKVTKEAESEKIKISEKAKSDIANLTSIPSGITSVLRATLVQKRNKEIAAIQSKASSDLNKLSSDAKTTKDASSNYASKQIAKTVSDLKDVISKTRDAYNKAKEQLNSGYEADYNREYSNVLNTIKGKTKSTKASTGTKSTKAAKEKQGGIIYYNGIGETKR